MHWKNGLAQGFALFTHGEAARMAINSIHNLVFDDGAVRVTMQQFPSLSTVCLVKPTVSVTSLQTPTCHSCKDASMLVKVTPMHMATCSVRLQVFA